MNKEIYYSYQVLSQVYVSHSYASIELNKLLGTIKKERCNTKLVTKIVYGVMERDVSLEYILKQFVSKMPTIRAQLILKMGLYMHFFLNSMPDYTIVNELVNLTKTTPEKHVSGFVNGTLKNIFKGNVILPKKEEDIVTYLSVKYGYPIWLIKVLQKQMTDGELEKLLSTRLTTDTHIRVIKDVNDWKALLDKHQIRYTTTIDDSCMYVDYDAILEHPEWKQFYVVQGLPSIIVCKNMGRSSKILDVCAAPGGKSMLLASIQPSANITSCDLYPHRVELIANFAKSLKLTNVSTCVMDATKCNTEWIEKFDGVLCDVPCSGTGVIGKKPDILLNRSQENIEELKVIQQNILETSSTYVKKGGCLIYSTCSILKEENEDIVNAFLKKHKDFRVLSVETYGIDVMKSKDMITFYPHISKTEGFFIVRMEKI